MISNITARRQDGEVCSKPQELHKVLLIQQYFAPFLRFLPYFTFAFPRSQLSICARSPTQAVEMRDFR